VFVIDASTGLQAKRVWAAFGDAYLFWGAMIHLVGISHQFQWWARDTTPLDLLRPNEYTDRFAAWFRPSAAEIRPDAIGEEHEKLMLRGG
jgi:hypothetical protein